jgi:hypothetical protein
MVILHIPVREEEVRTETGERRELLRLTEGFWMVEKPGHTNVGNQNMVPLANLIQHAIVYLDLQDIPSTTPVYIKLAPSQFANVGDNDEQASLNNDLTPPV